MEDKTEIIEERTEEQEKIFIESFADDEDVDLSELEEKAQILPVDDAKNTVLLGLGFSEMMVKKFCHESFAYDQKLAQDFAEKAAPVLQKHSFSLPPWLAAYKEEIALLGASVMLLLASVAQIKALKAQDLAQQIAQNDESKKVNDAAD